jgi:hypothetical protein
MTRFFRGVIDYYKEFGELEQLATAASAALHSNSVETTSFEVSHVGGGDSTTTHDGWVIDPIRRLYLGSGGHLYRQAQTAGHVPKTYRIYWTTPGVGVHNGKTDCETLRDALNSILEQHQAAVA